MKLIFILFFSIFSTTKDQVVFELPEFFEDDYVTVQEPDIILNGTDTIYVQSFPLEELKLAKRPFWNKRVTQSSTACHRGYKAIWKIIDNKLYLAEIINCSTINKIQKQDIKKLFRKNKMNYRLKDGMVIADWLTMDFYNMNFYESSFFNNKIYLSNHWAGDQKYAKQNLRLKIKNGEIIENKLFE